MRALDFMVGAVAVRCTAGGERRLSSGAGATWSACMPCPPKVSLPVSQNPLSRDDWRDFRHLSLYRSLRTRFRETTRETFAFVALPVAHRGPKCDTECDFGDLSRSLSRCACFCATTCATFGKLLKLSSDHSCERQDQRLLGEAADPACAKAFAGQIGEARLSLQHFYSILIKK